MRDEDETRKQVEEDANEDLDLNDEQADKIGGGHYIDKPSPNIANIPPTPPKAP
jgi:hypothetical protein